VINSGVNKSERSGLRPFMTFGTSATSRLELSLKVFKDYFKYL
jgi:hypothetical protein